MVPLWNMSLVTIILAFMLYEVYCFLSAVMLRLPHT